MKATGLFILRVFNNRDLNFKSFFKKKKKKKNSFNIVNSSRLQAPWSSDWAKKMYPRESRR